MQGNGSSDLVVRDSGPMRAVDVCAKASGGAVLLYWAIERPLIGVPLLLGLVLLLVVGTRSSSKATVANSEGIAGLRVLVPRSQRVSRLRRREVVSATTPWDQIESVTVGPWGSVSLVRVRLTDGREADLGVTAVTRRGLRKIASDLERRRPQRG